MTWVDTLISTDTPATTQDIFSLMSTLDPDERRGATVTRIIACLALTGNTTGVADGVMSVDFGIGVASQEAFTAGSLSDPTDPAAQPIRGWLYRCRQMITQTTEAGHPDTELHWVFDVRSQRKLDTGELFLIWEPNLVSGSAFTVRVVGSVRTLLKLA